MIKIAVDVMGGDYAPQSVLKGVYLILKELSEVSFLLVGPKDVFKDLPKDARLECIYTQGFVSMEDQPHEALKKKRDASLFVGLDLLREGLAQAYVSAGNSGAVVAGGIFLLGRLKGVRRPAIATLLPTLKDPMVLIDAGANVDSKPYDLYQFGLMASLFLEKIWNRKNPKIALLSIGEEKGKGNQLVRQAHELFQKSNLNYRGNVEGRDLYFGEVEVVVCDGFIGNICLKLSEGLAEAIMLMLKEEVKKYFGAILGMFLAQPALKNFKRKTDWREYGGAPLLGVKGNVIIAHGKSDALAIKNAILQAYKFAKINLWERLEEAIAQLALEEEDSDS